MMMFLFKNWEELITLKKQTFFTIVLIIFYLVLHFCLNIFADSLNINLFLKSIVTGVLTVLCLYIYFKYLFRSWIGNEIVSIIHTNADGTPRDKIARERISTKIHPIHQVQKDQWCKQLRLYITGLFCPTWNYSNKFFIVFNLN